MWGAEKSTKADGSPPSPSSPPSSTDSDSSDWSDVEHLCDCSDCQEDARQEREEDELRERLDVALERLECPFTWNTPAMQHHQVKDITLTNKGRMPMVWNEVIIKTKLAYTLCVKKGVGPGISRAPQYIAEAYMRLLPAFDEADELVREYGDALRYFVDATWAHVCRLVHGDDSEALRALVDFVDALPSGASLCPRQRSALLIVRAKCEHYPESVPLARKAIDLYPDEGHWYCVLSKLLCSGRFFQKQLGESRSGYSKNEQMKAAVTGFEKRKTVESYLMLSRAHQDAGNSAKAMEVMKEAVDAYPRSAWVLVEAAELMGEAPKALRDTRCSLRWLQRALDCPGGQCPAVGYQLGVLLLECGELKQARPHLERAAAAMEEAKELLGVIDSMRARAGSMPIHFVRSDGASPIKLFNDLRAGAGLSMFQVGGATIPSRSGRKRF